MRYWELCTETKGSQHARHSSILLFSVFVIFAPVASAQAPKKRPPQTPAGMIRGTVTVTDQQSQTKPLEGVRLELDKLAPDSKPLETVTDADGHYEFSSLPAGVYNLRVNQQGLKPFLKAVTLAERATIVEDVALNLETVTQEIEVTERTEPLSTENSAAESTVSNQELENLPLARQKFRDALPVIPGVVRTLDGKLTLRGTSETQGMLQVGWAKTVDPVTGSFSIPVPMDAIQTVTVDKTPFSAENGGFSGGLTTIETNPPSGNWHYGIRDFGVRLRGKNGHLRGISQATPGVSFGGPLIKSKLNFSESFEYDVRRDWVRGLAWPHNEIKRQGFNSFTNFQAILSPDHVLNVDVNVFPMRTQFADLRALVPQTASSDYNQKGVSIGVADLHNFSDGQLLRIGFRYTRFDSNARGQGFADMLVTPDGWGGNFFDSWNRTANQYEVSPMYQFAPSKWRGRHEIRIGVDVSHRNFNGTDLPHPIQVLRQNQTPAEIIRFTGQGPLSANATDVEEFIQDHWTINEHLVLDAGARLTSQTVGRATAFGPRAGLAYSPGKNQKTVFRVGAGLFYDRVSLLEMAFAQYPVRTIGFLDPFGQPLGAPVPLLNAYVVNGSGPLLSRLRSEPNTSPRGFVGHAEVDRQLGQNAVVRVSYLYSQTDNLFVVNPLQNVFGPNGLLGLFSTGEARYHEVETTLRFRPVKAADLTVSYIWSRARGDLNTMSDVFMTFQQPVIRSNVSGILPSDVPHRVIVSGIAHLPWQLTLSPVVDVHSGFAFSNVDVLQNYVGTPNGQRYPTFFSLDAQVYRDFPLRLPFVHHNVRHKLRLGAYTINATNHHNFNNVYNNVTSPFFGQFTGFQRRTDGFILSFVD
jgi:Carboxypeptidase regulatory-like domain